MTFLSEYCRVLSVNREHLFGFYLADCLEDLGSRCMAGSVKLILVFHAVKFKVEQIEEKLAERIRQKGAAKADKGGSDVLVSEQEVGPSGSGSIPDSPTNLKQLSL